jgi:hypothetical protein
MVKCVDGRKHVIVHGYEKKAGKKVSRYERGCPSSRFKSSDDRYFCCVCGEKSSSDDFHSVHIKGEIKSICNECIDTIHGLV